MSCGNFIRGCHVKGVLQIQDAFMGVSGFEVSGAGFKHGGALTVEVC